MDLSTIFSFSRSVFLLSLLVLCLPAKVLAEDELYDPWESFNRGVFAFNDTIDVYFMEPVAKGYKAVSPDFFRTGTTNLFNNIRYPVFLVSDLVQLKFSQAGQHTLRFLINSTIGIGGLIDVAKHIHSDLDDPNRSMANSFDLSEHEEDFGSALGYWGVPTGPYLVLPLLGPSNVRDAFGRAVDFFLNPTYYLDYTDIEHPFYYQAGARSLELVNDRASLIDAIETGKESSLDYYLFVQSAYRQIRLNMVYDNNPPEELKTKGSKEEPEDWLDQEDKDKP